ncbi:hypothetical protein LX15_001162 [Streptoalloteichus tenebrarius]|uniref:DUF1440 domain-containing protein n=2 Tax=Streptoalloteichus tenebrarius (strain ATCC 17920 / DSM 40477 / JCM 4838 / CBS 697.72 / NBRC 16177 / NCIMB 11028 / NRRL B-12390 / A12253. 1 / ISP 5477) TaxID=1933 RepID=A0ABT1HPP2_STRSD|nr:hypothetical protein [Streptoalloteichus tenebrarius]BFE98425.1 hypothetical protein GCM10020241_01010 [Streptoalloteichus tenebrarius]
MRPLVRGLLAGAAGTVALNVVTYLDMLVRARSSSSVPEEVAGRLAEQAGIALGDEQQAANRRSGAGALLGYVTGLGVGAAYGLLRTRCRGLPVWLAGPILGATAMASSDAPSVALGVTDPKSWGVQGWVSDIVPHLVYGVVTASTFNALTSR